MRTVTNINKNWAFSLDAKNIPDSFPKDWKVLDLPFTWNGEDGQDGGNNYLRTKGYFAKTLRKEELAVNDIAYIEFQAVNSTAEVFFNGKKLTTHHGGYSCFRVKIDSSDIKEENLLVVTADNSPNDFVYPQMADFTFYGGIYRDVNIISVSREHFDLDYYGTPGIKVTPEKDGDKWEIEVEAFCEGEVRFSIFDAEGKKIAEKTEKGKNPEAEFEFDTVHLWDGIKDPYLYTAEAVLVVDGEEKDRVSTRFGCRTFNIDPEKGFFLNGRSYPLRGVSRHQDRPGIGNALLPEHHREDIDLILEVGANTVRLAHYQHSQVFYDLCDEKGLVLWAEIPYISKHQANGFDNTVSQMTELVTQNYNHPAIFVWGLSNEISMGGSADESLLKNHHALNDLCHKMDKTRPTVIAAVTMAEIDSEYVHISDVLSYNHYFGWYGGTTDMNGPWFDDFHKKYPKKAIGISEYGCEALNWHTSNPTQGDYTEEYQSYYHEELIKQIADRPYLWATHVWNMFDFAADARSEGGEDGMNHKGLVTFDRKYKKDSFYAYKAWLNPEKMVHICSKRYVDRVEDKTKVTVYSNCDEVELFVNGKSVGKQKKGKYPFFYFEVENKGETVLQAKAGDITDEAKIVKVDTPNEDYILKEEGAVINWFEIDTPAGYLSINDPIGDIWKTMKGKIVLLGVAKGLLKKMKSKDGGNKEVAGFDASGMKISPKMINKNTIGMVKGFSIKRVCMMAKSLFTKEELLSLNAKLNKIKKK
ncbi:MAG: glycoside hydrolase family 2 protein [Ruminococcaceae bacterium]|nr:glycoside hydrolase family 2 protein [Oscillospiraceae bacterium]MBR3596711.1 glycoside hydrolase family 2 protein [Clostridia bacterium]